PTVWRSASGSDGMVSANTSGSSRMSRSMGKGPNPTEEALAASRPSWQDRRVETLEFDACISSGEAPVDTGLLDITVVPPRANFLDECVSIGNAAVQALASEHAQLRLGHVEPTPVLGRVMDLQLVG